MEDEWSRLARDWQAGGLTPSAIEARVRRGARQHRAAVAVEWVAGAAVLGFWAWQAVADPRPVTWVMGAGSVVFVVAWLVALGRTLRPPDPVVETAMYLRMEAERARAEGRWFVFVQRALYAFGAFAVLTAGWKLVVDWELYRAEPWRGVLGFGGLVVLLGALVWFARWRRRRALGLAERFDRMLERVGGDG